MTTLVIILFFIVFTLLTPLVRHSTVTTTIRFKNIIAIVTLVIFSRVGTFYYEVVLFNDPAAIILINSSIANGKCMEVVSTKGENINICWSPDGNTIAVGNKVAS